MDETRDQTRPGADPAATIDDDIQTDERVHASHEWDAAPSYEEEQPADDFDAPTRSFEGYEAPTEQIAQPTYWETPKPAPRQRSLLSLALTWVIAATLGAGIGAGAMLYFADRTGVGGARIKVVEPPVQTTGATGEKSAAAVAKAVLPSIVRIDVASGFGGGVGSGVVYDDAGHILTNNHVVANSSRIEVSLPSGDTVPGTLVGSASSAGIDIAVIKVESGELTPATFGSAKDLEVGELAVAVGSPFGLDATVTAGVISALHRNEELPGGERFTDAIQTDAPINPGNSGGALANARGEVIGINTAILGGQGNVGVGFAIPIDIARKVADQIIATGQPRLAYLGITGANLPSKEGARVIEVLAGGPADQAGIKANDIIVSLEGEKVESMDALIAMLIQRDVGDTVEIVVERGGEPITVRAKLTQRPTG